MQFTTSETLVVKSTMFLHQNIRKYSWISLDWENHDQIDHILISQEMTFKYLLWELTSDHCLVVAKVLEKLSVSRQVAQKFDMERFSLKKFNELEVREQY